MCDTLYVILIILLIYTLTTSNTVCHVDTTSYVNCIHEVITQSGNQECCENQQKLSSLILILCLKKTVILIFTKCQIKVIVLYFVYFMFLLVALILQYFVTMPTNCVIQ